MPSLSVKTDNRLNLLVFYFPILPSGHFIFLFVYILAFVFRLFYLADLSVIVFLVIILRNIELKKYYYDDFKLILIL